MIDIPDDVTFVQRFIHGQNVRTRFYRLGSNRSSSSAENDLQRAGKAENIVSF